MSSVGSNAGLDTYCMHFMAGQTNLHMSMAMDCLLLASWLGAFSVVVYTIMLWFGSLYLSKGEQ